MYEDNHLFQGLKRDNHPIRQDAKFLWDAHNIRITNRDDSTLFSITNERGTEDTKVSVTGTYVGHCVLGEYLVIFTHRAATEDTKDIKETEEDLNIKYLITGTDSKVIDAFPLRHKDFIYRLENTSEGWKGKVLFEGDLNISPDNPIEAIGDYETALIQKVYWVDGHNQPRVINIAEPELLGDNWGTCIDSTVYDFVQTLQLNEVITIEKNTSGSGIFSSGVIQYAFTYYNKYGQESNIFYTSRLFYIAPKGRGGNPEETISNSFSIKVENLENKKFDYIRIYSICRTSIDTTPAVKRVVDIPLKDVNTVVFEDTGTIGDNVDPTELLYIGGENIVAHTLTSKDGTLFLGNLEISRPNLILDNKEVFVNTDGYKPTAYNKDYTLPVNVADTAYYNYSWINDANASGFKVGECYRLGIQAQYKNGKWSEPVLVDKKFTIEGVRPTITNSSDDTSTLKIPSIQFTLKKSVENELVEKGYKRVRGVVVFPKTYERTVIAQGMLCPTVFNWGNRMNNAPFSQSSWFLRPILPIATPETYYSNTVPSKGNWVEYRPFYRLRGANSRGGELQNSAESNDDNSTKIQVDKINSNDDTYNNEFFVDQSIVTFHSPDIEFDTSTRTVLESSTLKCRIVGLVEFDANAGDIDIQTSTPVIGEDSLGFVHRTQGITDSTLAGLSLVAGGFYRDSLVDDTDKTYEELTKYYQNDIFYMVYPWHRRGSLNNDCNRPADKGTRSAVLSKKKISNMKFSKGNTWLNSVVNIPAGKVEVFSSSDELSLIKLEKPNNSTINSPTYYGNVDTLIGSTNAYPLYIAPEDFGATIESIADLGIKIGDYNTKLKESIEPIRMRYKSSPHAVFALSYNNGAAPTVLPCIRTTSGSIINETYKVSSVPAYDSGTNAIDPGSLTYVTYGIDSPVDNLGSGYCILSGKNSKGTTFSKNDRDQYTDFEFLYAHKDGVWTEVSETAVLSGRYYYDPSKDIFFIGAYDAEKDIYYMERTEKQDIESRAVTVAANDVYSVTQTTIKDVNPSKPFLYLAELYRDTPENVFGGEDIKNCLWIPAGEPVTLNTDEINETNENGVTDIQYTWGDTWYQRYDCLKTYPYTQEDENQIIEIGSFMCETHINIDGRYDRNRGQISNLNMTPQNFNLLNEVYTQSNNFFNYRVLDEDYYKQSVFKNQITWSLEKAPAIMVDPWTNITLSSTADLNGDSDEITKLITFNDILLCFQKKAVSQILFNSRVQIPTSEGTPIEISNNYKVDGTKVINDNVGCSNKWSIKDTPTGVYFIDNNTDTLWLYNGELTNISETLGMKWWFQNNHTTNIWNPLSSNSIRTFYDSMFKDVYFTPGNEGENTRDALCYSEHLGQFTSQLSYGGTQAMFNFNNSFYSLKNDGDSVKLWENFKGKYNNFFNSPKGFDISFISNDNPTITKIFDTVEFRADVFSEEGGKPLYKEPFDYIRAENEYQDSGESSFSYNGLRKKFRAWRALVPRASEVNVAGKETERKHFARARVRNPWAKITLGTNDPETNKYILHDVSVKYTI